jgi:D-alanyl-D-alanine carboxypeptidase (penicillin-binding protein 5/6)
MSFRSAVFILLACAVTSTAATAKKPKSKAGLSKRLNRSVLYEELPAGTARTSPVERPDPRNFHQLAEGELPLAARGAIVLDGYTGRSLYEKNADEPQYPASTTKIMTALLVIEAGDLDREVEISDEDARVGESTLNIRPGERYTRRQMLFGLMLKSANDVAHSLARDNAGSVEAFGLKMTIRAQELGATSTSFRNPHGLHSVEHFTTPRDLAFIARAAMQQPYFRQVVATLEHPWVTSFAVQPLRNHNRLLTQFPGCIGVKTGYTNPAQQVLASAALRDGREVISVIMHSDKPGIWEDSKLLLTYGLDHPPGAPTVALPEPRQTASHP